MKRSKLLSVICLSVLLVTVGACSQDGFNPLEVERYEHEGASYTLIVDAYAVYGMAQRSGIILLEDDTKEIVWTYGADEIGGMIFAHSAEFRDDELLIADTEKCRVFIARATNDIFSENPDFHVVWNSEEEGDYGLLYPNDCDFIPNGNILITDRDSHRVIEVNPETGDIDWQFGVTGEPGNDDAHLFGPHNADRLAGGNTIVADSNNNRVLEIDPAGDVVWEYNPVGADALRWPRDADALGDGNVLISDSRGGRVIEVTSAGDTVWEFEINIILTQTEPYEADLLENGNILIAAPGLSITGCVFEVDYLTQQVVWRYPDERG